MNVFLFNFSDPILYDIALKLNERGDKIQYWTGHKPNFDRYSKDKENFPNTIFHDFLDALRGKGADSVQIGDFKPVGENIFNALYECESVTMANMCRFDLDGMPFDQKKRLYNNWVYYWYNVIRI